MNLTAYSRGSVRDRLLAWILRNEFQSFSASNAFKALKGPRSKVKRVSDIEQGMEELLREGVIAYSLYPRRGAHSPVFDVVRRAGGPRSNTIPQTQENDPTSPTLEGSRGSSL